MARRGLHVPGRPERGGVGMASPRLLDTVDHSSRTIAKLLRKAGARLVAEAEPLYSADGKGTLVEVERDPARAGGTRHSGLPPVAQGSARRPNGTPHRGSSHRRPSAVLASGATMPQARVLSQHPLPSGLPRRCSRCSKAPSRMIHA
jgi:hypothetical protein